ncbi:MAG: addiction module protein [Verrucomicrobiota bacterium]
MSATVNRLFEEALLLPTAYRANLAEKLVESIETDIDPRLERAHLHEIQRRRDEVSPGFAKILPGKKVMADARARVQ